ncbi:MAG: C40 family peptidase [Gemmatimonadota bacterium]|nr:C40 family peptidase [Gemmatimonadota bacterium]
MTAFRPSPGGRLIVPAAIVPVRRNATHRSELTSQWILGEILIVESTEGSWVRARGPDGYAGWTPLAPFRHVAFDAEDWDRTATSVSRGTDVSSRDGAGAGRLERLPWGARVRRAGHGISDVVLPDGRVVTPLSPERIVLGPDSSTSLSLAYRLPQTIVATAREWLGVPYLWGGRTELGADCSGFVQAVYATVCLSLPRDSRDQAAAGEEPPRSGDRPREPGDLLFFAPEGDGITHVAISLGGSRIIHAASSNGCVREDDLDDSDPLADLLRASVVRHTRPAAPPAQSV